MNLHLYTFIRLPYSPSIWPYTYTYTAVYLGILGLGWTAVYS